MGLASLEIAKMELGELEKAPLVERFIDVWMALDEFRQAGRSSEIREWITGGVKGGATPTVRKSSAPEFDRLMSLDRAQRNAHLSHDLEVSLLAIAYGQVAEYWDLYKWAGLSTDSVFSLGGFRLSAEERAKALSGSQKRSVIKLKAMLLVLSKGSETSLSALSELILCFEVYLGIAQQNLISDVVVAKRMMSASQIVCE